MNNPGLSDSAWKRLMKLLARLNDKYGRELEKKIKDAS